MKVLGACILTLIIAVTAFAGEGASVVSAVENTSPLRNTVAPPVIKESYKYYEVSGCCEKDLHCDLIDKCIRMQNGKKADSTTAWKIKWNYGHTQSSNACIAEAFTVTVDVVFNMPKWVPNGKAPLELEEKWSTYVEKLMLHERGHRDRAVDAANSLTRAVAGLTPPATCEALEREINSLSRKQLENLVKEQEKYDAVTRHGSTQGAVFP